MHYPNELLSLYLPDDKAEQKRLMRKNAVQLEHRFELLRQTDVDQLWVVAENDGHVIARTPDGIEFNGSWQLDRQTARVIGSLEYRVFERKARDEDSGRIRDVGRSTCAGTV